MARRSAEEPREGPKERPRTAIRAAAPAKSSLQSEEAREGLRRKAKVDRDLEGKGVAAALQRPRATGTRSAPARRWLYWSLYQEVPAWKDPAPPFEMHPSHPALPHLPRPAAAHARSARAGGVGQAAGGGERGGAPGGGRGERPGPSACRAGRGWCVLAPGRCREALPPAPPSPPRPQQALLPARPTNGCPLETEPN
jgi:hypothetical protein